MVAQPFSLPRSNPGAMDCLVPGHTSGSSIYDGRKIRAAHSIENPSQVLNAFATQYVNLRLSGVVSGNVAVQVVDHIDLRGDNPVHQIADRDHADRAVAFHHDQVA